MKLKIAVLFALLFVSMSWSSDPNGWYIEYLSIRFGTQSAAKKILTEAGYTIVSNPSGPQDFVANTGCGGSCYTFMGFTKTWTIKNVGGNTDVLPVRNIIVQIYNTTSPATSFYLNGCLYQLVYGYDSDNKQITDLCNGKCKYNNKNNRHVYIYYTRDNIDDKVVEDVRAVAGENNLFGYDYERISGDLTGGAGEKPIYLYQKRAYPQSRMRFYPEPTGRDGDAVHVERITYTGTPRTLLWKFGTPTSESSVDHVEYKIDNGPWSTAIPKATNVGTYRIYAKIISKSATDGDYIYGNTESTKIETPIYKATKLVLSEYEPDALGNANGQTYYLYNASFYNYELNSYYNAAGGTVPTNYYSNDKISLTWSDKCYSTSRSFYFRKSGSSKDSSFSTSGMKFLSGTYSFYVNFAETDNCRAINEQFASFTVKPSKLFFDSNGGSSVATIEGETGASYTKPANPTRTGYSFTGWSPALPSTIQRGEKTYKAGWTINKYTMTFDANGGKFSDGASIKRITQNYNTSITKPANPTKTDSAFVQWKQTSPASSNTTVPSIMPAQNITFTAQWKYDRFKVNMPSLMEVVSGEQASDGTYLNGSTVKFRVQSGYVVWGTVTYNGTVVTPDANGIYTIKVLGKNASVSATAFAEDHGAIQIAVDRSKAIIDGNKTGLVTDVPTAIAVRSVEMARTFTPFTSTTIAVPFTVDLEYVWGGIFCEFLGMDRSGFKYTARLMFVSTKLEANVPYVFVPFDQHITIELPQGWTLPIKTEEKSIKFGDWSFNSVYHNKVWSEGVSEEDGEGVVAYNFNASQSQTDGVSGSFVKLTDGSVGAMQAYISYAKDAPQAINRSPAMAGKSASSFSIEDLPDEIDVEIVTEDKKTVGLGKINTVTGKIKLDSWFDMNGNLLKGKPTAKGVYYNNGKQVIVK